MCKDDDKREQSDRGSPEIFIQEKTELDGLEKHCCIRCEKVGEMLVCSEIGCPVAIHKDCLVPNAYFDDSGSFYCPYCSYKRAVDNVQRLKNKAIAAKQVLSKFLKVDSFGGEEPENDKKEKSATPPHSDDKKQQADEIQLDQHVDEKYVAAATEKCDLEAAKDNEETQQVRKEDAFEFDAAGEDLENKSHESPNESVSEDVEMEKNVAAAAENCDLEAAKENEETQQVRKEDAFGFNAGEGLENKSHESHNENVSEEDVEVEQNNTAPKSSTCVRKNPSSGKKKVKAFPSQRRRKLMWTPEEEDMLKDGVKIYSKNPNKNLPWKKILALGSHVFHNTRYPADLQNKWKNMTRKEKLG